MSLIRFTLDLAIPKDVYNAIPKDVKIAVRDKIRQIKSYAVKINEGLPNEEMTVKATWHVCHHDTNESCEAETEI